MVTQKKVWGERIIASHLAGVDICEVASELADLGHFPSTEHVVSCFICTLQFLMLEADTKGYQAIQECSDVVSHLEAMSELFAGTGNVGDNQVYLEILAHFANAYQNGDCSCREDFLSKVETYVSFAKRQSNPALDQWRSTLPERLKRHREDIEGSATDESRED